MVQLRSIEISKDIQNRQPTRTITGTHDYRNPLHSLAAPEEIKLCAIFTPTIERIDCANQNANSRRLLHVVILGFVGWDGPARMSMSACSYFIVKFTGSYRPLGSVCFDHVGIHLCTVDAQ